MVILKLFDQTLDELAALYALKRLTTGRRSHGLSVELWCHQYELEKRVAKDYGLWC